MPAIRSQSINSNGFDIATPKFGLLHVVIGTGNPTSIVITKAGVEIQNTTINNATTAVVESVINNALNGQLLGAGVTQQDFYCAVHIVTLNPLVLNIISSNTPITGSWWLNG